MQHITANLLYRMKKHKNFTNLMDLKKLSFLDIHENFTSSLDFALNLCLFSNPLNPRFFSGALIIGDA